MVIRRNVALEQSDVNAIEELSKRKGLGIRGFSAALRMIIREWSGDDSQRIRLTDAGAKALKEEREHADIS